MIPQTILKNLARLRRRERLIALYWGAALWLAVVMTALLVACSLDWLIDRERDTPFAARCLFLVAQILLAAAAGFYFLIRPQLRRLGNDALALWVEASQPALHHRLITTVQLSRAGARSEGMSQELIAVVAREAESQCVAIDFAQIADRRRLRRAGQLLLPIFALAVLLVARAPSLVGVLLSRQLLADIDIPHSVAIEPLKLQDVRPAGEKVVLLFRVRSADRKRGQDPSHSGVLSPFSVGNVFVTPQDQPRDRYPLVFARWDGSDAIFETALAPSSANLTYTARLGDGRMRRPGLITMVPRPAVQEQFAWLQLPAFCGLRPDGSRYEQPQGHGDIVGILEASARVLIKTQKPVRRAFLQILGPEMEDSRSRGDFGSLSEATAEVFKREVVLDLSDDGVTAEGAFDLRPEESAYRIVTVDEYGFDNVPAPRRGLRLVPEEPPQVALLKEQMPPAGPIAAGSSWEDFELDGLPVVPGKKIRVGYVAQGPFGVGHARFLYRIIPKTDSGNEETKETPWRILPLPEINASVGTGAFDPKRGAFEHSPLDQTIYFHAVPSPDPDRLLGRTLAGGRFDFATKGIPDGLGGFVSLRVGDQFEFCVEVYSDKDPNSKRPSARSDIRTRPIISDDELFRWFADALQEERRLKDLDAKQRGVFELR